MTTPELKICKFATQLLLKVGHLEQKHEHKASESQPPSRCECCALCSWMIGCPHVSQYEVYARHSGIYEVKLTFKETNGTNATAESTSKDKNGGWLQGNLMILPLGKSGNHAEPNKFVHTTRPAGRAIWTQTQGPLCMESRLATIAQMLKECDKGLQSHTNCQPSDDWLPSRLIKISQPSSKHAGGAVDSLNLRLVKTSQVRGKSRTRYITLSHCWGQHQGFAGTLRNKLSEYFEEIPWKTFPKTFQDVALASHYLGIEHLWIDSLCIIQDDKQDWQYESALMAQVYTNSYLNIAAMSGNNSDFGLAIQIDLASEIKVKKSWASSSRAFAVRRIRLTAEGLLDSVVNSPLIERAWVLQETYLARRNLFFCNDQYYYECMGTSFSEDGMSEYHRGVSRDLLHMRFSRQPVRFKRIWRVLVDDYSNRKLTYKSDKLPGIAGVIHDITLRSPVKLRNVAGLFIWDGCEKSILHGLTWRSKEFTSTRPRIPSIPSWSWASVDGPVYGALVEHDPYSAADYPDVDILDIRLEWAGQEMTSEIKAAYLDLNTALFEAEIVQGQTSEQKTEASTEAVPSPSQKVSGAPLPRIAFFRASDLNNKWSWQSAPESRAIGSAFLDSAESPTQGQVTCLFLGTQRSRLNSRFEALDGLLVEKQPSESTVPGPPMYRRVAQVSLRWYSSEYMLKGKLHGTTTHQALIDYSLLEKQTIRLV